MDNVLNLFSILKFTICLGKKFGEKLQSPHNKNPQTLLSPAEEENKSLIRENKGHGGEQHV